MSVPATRRELDLSFEDLYRENVGSVRALAFNLIRDRAEAEDVAQSTFLNAYKALLRGAEPRVPRAWLLGIAKNLSRRHLHERGRARRLVPLDPDSLEAPAPSSGPTAGEIRSALERLGQKQRDALILREVHGLSYAELKDRLGLEPSVLQVLLFRARASLREVLEAREVRITCERVEALVQLQLSGEASHVEKRELRAHLRSCSACSTSARRLRARASRVGRLSGLLLPWGLFRKLGSLFGGSSASSALVVKTALVLGTAGIVGGAAVETGLLGSSPSRPPAPAVKAPRAAGQLALVDGKPRGLRRTVAKRAHVVVAGDHLGGARRAGVLAALPGANSVSTSNSERFANPFAPSDAASSIQAEASPAPSEPAPTTAVPALAPPVSPTFSSSSSESGAVQAPSEIQAPSVSLTQPPPISTVTSPPISTVTSPPISTVTSPIPVPPAPKPSVPPGSKRNGPKVPFPGEPPANEHAQGPPPNAQAQRTPANGDALVPPAPPDTVPAVSVPTEAPPVPVPPPAADQAPPQATMAPDEKVKLKP